MKTPKGIIDSLLPASEAILGIRNNMGAEKARVFILTRRWGGGEVGLGTPEDCLEEIIPTPHISSLEQDIRLPEGAPVQSGDVILKSISKNKYKKECEIDTRTGERDLEKFFVIQSRGGEKKVYQVVSIVEKYVTWSVHIRRQTTDDQILRELTPIA